MSQMPIELKGSNFTLSVVHLYHTQPERVQQALLEKINQAPAFLKNAPVVVNVAALSENVDWPQMQQAINATGLYIVGISGCTNEALRQKILQAGLPLLSAGKPASQKAEPAVTTPPAAKSHIVSTPVRSGQQIYARHADLIVISNVSAGAELVADGNIHIYGTMRGRALAGAGGDQNSQIFCTHLSAELVSIAGEYWLMDQIPADYFNKASRLFLHDGALAIETLN